MSYQPKSSPYALRTLPKGKRNNELQRLKSEYQRVRDFSDYTIAMRIRQVRLWRLFRKIQDINAISSSRAKIPRKQPKTYEQRRAETLSRARDLGMEYSRANGMNLQRHLPMRPRTSLLYLGDKPLLESKMSNTKRRLECGNIHSYENMRRFKSSQGKIVPSNTRTENSLRTASSIEMDRVEKLNKHTRYDGSSNACDRVTCNLKRYQRKSRSKQSSQRNSLPRTSESSGRFPNEMIKKYTFIVDESPDIQRDCRLMEADEQEEYVANLWNELRNRIPILRSVPIQELIANQAESESIQTMKNDQERLEEPQSSDSVDEQNNEEYRLRKISNDRNLPMSQLEYDTAAIPTEDSAEDLRISENERVIKISNLMDDDDGVYESVGNDSEKQHALLQRSSTSTECAVSNVRVVEQRENKVHAHPSLKKKPLTSLDLRTAQRSIFESHVDDFVKLYEPFPRFHQPEEEVEKPVKPQFESGVVKLRSIFEHQGQ